MCMLQIRPTSDITARETLCSFHLPVQMSVRVLL